MSKEVSVSQTLSILLETVPLSCAEAVSMPCPKPAAAKRTVKACLVHRTVSFSNCHVRVSFGSQSCRVGMSAVSNDLSPSKAKSSDMFFIVLQKNIVELYTQVKESRKSRSPTYWVHMSSQGFGSLTKKHIETLLQENMTTNMKFALC